MPRAFEIIARVRDQLSGPLANITRRFSSFTKTVLAFPFRMLSNLLGPRGLLFGAVGGFFGAKAFLDIADSLDQVGKTAERVRATAESVSALKIAGQLADLEMQQLNAGLVAFSRNVEAAKRQGGPQRNALLALGLDPNNLPGAKGDLLDLVELFSAIADNIQRIGGATARTDALTTLFGEAGARLGPLLSGGSEAFRKTFEGFPLFSQQQLLQAARFNDAIARVKIALTSLVQQVFLRYEPYISAFFDAIASFVRDGTDEFLNLLESIAKAVLSFASAVAVAVDKFSALIDLVGAASQAGSISGFFDSFFTDRASIADQIALLQNGQPTTPANDAELRRLESLARSRDVLSGRQSAVGGVEAAFNAIVERMRAIGLPDLPDQSRSTEISNWQRFVDGWKAGVDEMQRRLEEWEKFAQESFAQISGAAIDSLTDSLIEVSNAFGRLVTEGGSFKAVLASIKNAFSDFAQSVLEEIRRIIARMVAMRFVMAGIGFAGSFFGGGAPSPATSGGGNPIGLGDPLPDGGVVQLLASGGGGGGGIVVNINAVDSGSVARLFAQNGRELGQALSAQLARDGGLRSRVGSVRR